MAEKHSKLHLAAFTIETVAHLRGMEQQCLPQSEFVRKVDKALKRLFAEGPTSMALLDLRVVAIENEKES